MPAGDGFRHTCVRFQTILKGNHRRGGPTLRAAQQSAQAIWACVFTCLTCSAAPDMKGFTPSGLFFHSASNRLPLASDVPLVASLGSCLPASDRS